MDLFLDFDGVIADTVKAICELYHQDFALYDKYKEISPDKIDTWGFDELVLLPKGLLSQYFKQYRFFDVLPPVDAYCGEYVRHLGNMYNLRICTIGDKQNIRGKKEWLSLLLPTGTRYELLPVDFPSEKDKSNVDMRGGIIIDDNIENLITSNASIKICFGEVKGWNSGWNGLRCKDWKELMELMEYIYKFKEVN